MDMIFHNSYNALMKSHVMDIMNDNQERNLDAIRLELKNRYNLELDVDYKSMHLNNALALLKKEGKLKSTGHGRYEKQQMKVSENPEEQSEVYICIEVQENRKEISELMKTHYQQCRQLIQKIDFAKVSDQEFRQIEYLIQYKNYLESKIEEINDN